MAQWLKAYIAFPEERSLILSTHIRHLHQVAHNHLKLQLQKNPNPLVSAGTCAHSYNFTQTHRNTETDTV